MYCGFDTETTGLPGLPSGQRSYVFPDYRDLGKYDSARLIQVCFLLVNSDGIQKTYTRLINSGVNITNSEFHGITNAMVAGDGISLETFFLDLQEILSETNVLFAYNIQFDLNIIKSELFRYGTIHTSWTTFTNGLITTIDNKRYMCAMVYAASVIGTSKMPSLKYFYKYAFGKEYPKSHTADADVLAMYDAMVKYGFKFS